MPYKGLPCARKVGHTGGCLTSESMMSRSVRERKRYADSKVSPIRRYTHSPMTRQQRRMLVGLLKLAYGCTDCGYRGHPEALQFDHMPGHEKLGDVNKMVKYNVGTLFAEIAKCEVVCANCHAIRTATRRSAELALFPSSV